MRSGVYTVGAVLLADVGELGGALLRSREQARVLEVRHRSPVQICEGGEKRVEADARALAENDVERSVRALRLRIELQGLRKLDRLELVSHVKEAPLRDLFRGQVGGGRNRRRRTPRRGATQRLFFGDPTRPALRSRIRPLLSRCLCDRTRGRQ